MRLWQSVGPQPAEVDNDNSEGHAKPSEKRPKRSKSFSQDDTFDQGYKPSSDDDHDPEVAGIDGQETYTVVGSNPVRLAYSHYLAHTWLPSDQNHLCPVFKDDDNVVFCIPSMSNSSTKGKMQYGARKPVFIHIGKVADEKIAVVYSQCDKPGNFWPKERFHGILLTKHSLGFQKEENADPEQGERSHKRLCDCAWALLQIPILKSFKLTTKNMWTFVQSLHGENQE